jgi:hypothetical protein
MDGKNNMKHLAYALLMAAAFLAAPLLETADATPFVEVAAPLLGCDPVKVVGTYP